MTGKPSEKAPRPSHRTQTNVGRDTAEARESSIPFGWHVFREYYPSNVVRAVESLFDDNALNIQTVMMLQAADCLRVRTLLTGMSLETDEGKLLAWEKLAAAQRPVIVAGRGAAFADARAQIERLGDRIGALLATSLVAKGFFDGHPYDVGIAGSFSCTTTEKLLAEADLVIGIGASLNFFTSEGGLLFPAAQTIRIDTRAFAPTIGFTPGMHLQGDAKATTLALLEALEARGQRQEGFRNAATREALTVTTPQPARATDGLDARELMRALSRSLPARTQVVCGAGHFWSWPIVHLALPPGGRFQARHGTRHHVTDPLPDAGRIGSDARLDCRLESLRIAVGANG